MHFYEVFVSSNRYHGSEALTYSSPSKLAIGQLVNLPFGNTSALGIVVDRVKQPVFATKTITDTIATPIPLQLLALHQWIADYYPGPLGLITQLFIPSSLAKQGRKPSAKPKLGETVNLPTLTNEQTKATQQIESESGPFLLFGETGSGKTRVYTELTRQAMARNTSVLILTPEIGLTPQLVASLEASYPGRVVVMHSTQTPAEKRNSWNWINSASEPLVIIGPRSALFSPIHNLGYVIVDEAHDTAYKQEQMPYYQASHVAAKLASLHGAKLVLGSATPLVRDFFTFTQKKRPIIRMEQLATGGEDGTIITVVDLKQRDSFSRSPWLSNDLLTEIDKALQQGNQSLVFLNRRGTARIVLCQSCGWQSSCPRCDVPLTYHGDHHHLRCHTCGFTTNAPAGCPDCGSADIQFKSIGTKTITAELERLFPGTVIQRFDSDVKKDERLEAQYDSIQSGKTAILVGTQMLTKGLDLPKLQVVGVVLADTGLYFPDYTAEERTYQMLRQVIGRVGRGHNKGTVIIQTYHPENPVIKAAAAKDYQQFYDTQLAERELYRFPPYYFVLKIGVERAVQSSARQAASDIASSILNGGFAIELSGPAPAFVEKTRGKFKWQLVIKAKQRSELVKIIRTLPKNCSYDIDPTNLL